MLKRLKEIFAGERLTLEDIKAGVEVFGSLLAPAECPYSRYIRHHGVPARVFQTTRNDN